MRPVDQEGNPLSIGDRVVETHSDWETPDSGRVLRVLEDGYLWIGWEQGIETEVHCKDLLYREDPS